MAILPDLTLVWTFKPLTGAALRTLVSLWLLAILPALTLVLTFIIAPLLGGPHLGRCGWVRSVILNDHIMVALSLIRRKSEVFRRRPGYFRYCSAGAIQCIPGG